MFNVAVLKMKDIIKYLVGVTITIFVVVITARYFSSQANKKNKPVLNIERQISKITEKSYLTCIGKTMSVANVLNNEYQQIAKEDDENEEFNYLEGFLETEISSIKGLEKVEKKKLENQNEETRFFSNSTRRGKY